MPNPRIEAYARLLVERSIDVQPGWQVLVVSTPLARPLIEEVVRLIAQRGAYALMRLGFAPLHPGALPLTIDLTWARAADQALLGELAPIDRYAFEHANACIFIMACGIAMIAALIGEHRRVKE
jgi:aminopeptidase